jgi:hypothetical protein
MSQRGHDDIDHVDTSIGEMTLTSSESEFIKNQWLSKISVECLFELCSKARINTTAMDLQHNTIWPKQEVMIDKLIDFVKGNRVRCL